MAGIGDYFAPMTDALPGPTVVDQFLANPRNSAFLLQAGLNMMQPQAWGDNGVSQLGRALGGGAEAQSRQEAMDQKQQESESRTQLREAQASAAEARAGRAAAGTDTAAARLALMQSESDRKREAAAQSLRLRAGLGYAATVQKIQQSNAFLPVAERQPIPTFDEHLKSMGLSREMLGGPGAAGEAPGGMGDTELGATPSSYPVAKPGDSGRAPGIYSTPKGPMRWDGSGWNKV
jgi:hypothetical protein